VLKVADEVDVKLLEIDAKTGKMRLSMRALTEKPEGYVEPKGRGPRREGGDRGPRREGDRGPRRDGDRGPRRDGDRGPRREGRSEGPRKPRFENEESKGSEPDVF